MTKAMAKRIRRRVHGHTLLVMIECADQGHGCDNRCAHASAERLIALIEEVASKEYEAGATALARSGVME